MKSINLYLITFFLLSFFSFSQEKEGNSLLLNKDLNNFKYYQDHKYKKALKLFKDEKYSLSLKASLELLSSLDSLYGKDNSNNLYVKTNILIGDLFKEINNRDKAIFHYKKALNTTQKIHLLKKESILTNNSITKEINLPQILLKIGSQYDKINQKDSAIKYYKKILSFDNLKESHLSSKASAYNNLSNIFREDSLYDIAKNYSYEAVKIYEKTNEKILHSAALGTLASIYLEQNDYTKAKRTYLDGLNLIKRDTSNKANRYKEYLYFNLAYTLYLLKDYKAYDYQEKSFNIKDNLRDKEIRRVLEEIYTKHELNLEKEKTSLVEEQRKLIEAKDYKMSWLFAALSLLVIVISGVVIYNYKLRQKNLKLKLSENNLLQQQSIEKLKSEAQIKILNATIDAKENERKQIAETLHDNVSALLSSANMHLRASKKQFGDTQPQEIEKTQTIILEASQKVRDLSHNLVSSILLKFGLEYALKDIAKKYSNSELIFDVNAQNINRYNQEFEIKIFNVIQELINNIIKHSKANQAKIAIAEKENQLTILVKDDGVGFTTSSSSLKDGIGLNQIEARVKVMNGKLNIYSEPNKGTEVSIIVPIQQQKKSFTLTSVS